jgi:UDP-glucose 4-epimerase
LAAGGHEVVSGTRSPTPQPGSFAGAKQITMNWNSDDDLRVACRNMDGVVHLAGMNATKCAADPAAALSTYGEGTTRLARAAAAQEVSRFIYVSSVHVYGAALAGVVDEDTPLQPRHPYASGHALAESATRAARTTGLSTVIVRLTNAFGAPADSNPGCWTLLVNDLCLQAVRTRRMVLRTAGTQRRDFVPLNEVCRALVLLLELPEALLGLAEFNLGSGRAIRIIDMAKRIAERVRVVLGYVPELQTGEASDGVGGTLDTVSIARLGALGFVPRAASTDEELDELIFLCSRLPN